MAVGESPAIFNFKGVFVEAWHFVSNDNILRDGRPVPALRETLTHPEQDLRLCESGLHASARLIDALTYAPGTIVCKVKCGGRIINGVDKVVCSKRTIYFKYDCQEQIRAFSRWCALQVIDLWKVPEKIEGIVEYLSTGQEALIAKNVRDEVVKCVKKTNYGADFNAIWAAIWSIDSCNIRFPQWAAIGAARRARYANPNITIDEQNAKLTQLIIAGM